MTRRELIQMNQADFSKMRKWAMERNYRAAHTFDQGEKKILGAGFAAGVAMVSAPNIVMAGVAGGIMVSTAGAAAAVPVGMAIAVKSVNYLERVNFHKKVVLAALNLGDRAKSIFRRVVDKMSLIPVDMTRSREFALSLAKIKFHSDSIYGVSQTNKERFTPDVNVYMPTSQLDADSPIYAKNKEIYNEIASMIKLGVLLPAELVEIDEYTKGATSFSGDAFKYNQMVNYSVTVKKLEAVYDRLAGIQTKRESLKVDDAPAIERAIRKEEGSRVVKTSVELNEALSSGIREITAEVDAAAIKETNQEEAPLPAKELHQMGRAEYEEHFAKINSFVQQNPAEGGLKDAAKEVSKITSKPIQPTVK